MLCLNIKNGMKEYITNTFLKKQIDNNYDELKLLVSELDAETKLMVENATDSNTLLVSNDLFKYLEKYNINVISLENNNNLNDQLINEAKIAIDSGAIKYIIMMPNDTLSDKVEDLISRNNIEKLYFNSITTLSATDEKNGKDYLTIMRENLELLEKELYAE
jgi:zinc transport system substrate-binding protein